MDKNINIPVSEIISLKDYIEYSDGSIVSKTIIKTEAANITLFACDEGQKISEHTTPHDALVTVLDGEAVITLDGKDVTVKEGQSLLMPADVPHALRADKRYKKLLFMIKG